MRWQVVSLPDDTKDQSSGELYIGTIATMTVVTDIPPGIKEVIVHTCACGYMRITRTADNA